MEMLRKELLMLLDNGRAYETQEAILAGFPARAINAFPPNVPYTPWHLLEHIRFCQQEILEQIEADEMPDYTFPDDFWPAPDARATPEMWNESVTQFFLDRDRLMDLAQEGDLAAPCRHNPDATLLHALFNIAAHNHYHFGEFAVLRSVMLTWPENRAS